MFDNQNVTRVHTVQCTLDSVSYISSYVENSELKLK